MASELYSKIVLFYIVFIAIYAIVIYGVSSATGNYDSGFGTKTGSNNITMMNEEEITAMPYEDTIAMKCNSNDALGCALSVMGGMFNYSSISTPFVFINIFLGVFTLAFIISLVFLVADVIMP